MSKQYNVEIAYALNQVLQYGRNRQASNYKDVQTTYSNAVLSRPTQT